MSAAKYGHLKVLKYAHENGCRWDKWTCSYAAQFGYLEILKYLHENGCSWTEEKSSLKSIEDNFLVAFKHNLENPLVYRNTKYLLSAHENTEILQYLKNQECLWSPQTCSVVYKTGNLEMIKYLCENGCPWNHKLSIS